jgi:hypothetical protein
MATIFKLNDIACDLISKVNDIAKSGITYFDDNSFCPSGPTPTPTPTPTATPTPTVTPTPTPTPTLCPEYCCEVLLCYSNKDCRDSCSCNDLRRVYLHIQCADDPCILDFANGIYTTNECTIEADAGYYSDGTNCYLWQGGTLSFSSTC